MRVVSCTTLAVVLMITPLHAGFKFSQNFTAFTPASADSELGNAFAMRLVERAEEYRQEIAEEWLGKPLPDGTGKTTINISFSNKQDSGLTWAKDSPARKYHMLYLTTSPDRALGSTLKHEMAHVVLATRFPHPHRLPAWLEEGIASRYDDPERQADRRDTLARMARDSRWPRLELVLGASNIVSDDNEAYTVATSLTELLLSRGDKKTLLEFGEQAASGDVEAALQKHFGIQGLGELQAVWQAWLRDTNRGREGQSDVAR